MIFTLHFWLSFLTRWLNTIHTCKPGALLLQWLLTVTKFKATWKKSYCLNFPQKNHQKYFYTANGDQDQDSGSLAAIPSFPSAVLVDPAIPLTSLGLFPMPNAWRESRVREKCYSNQPLIFYCPRIAYPWHRPPSAGVGGNPQKSISPHTAWKLCITEAQPNLKENINLLCDLLSPSSE